MKWILESVFWFGKGEKVMRQEFGWRRLESETVVLNHFGGKEGESGEGRVNGCWREALREIEGRERTKSEKLVPTQ